MVLLIINSCKKDTTPTPNNNLTDLIKEAKVFIEQQNTTTLSQKNKLGADLNYIWDKANVFINSDSIKTVEIPLASYKKGYVLGDRNPKAAMASITRLVVKKDKNGELTAFLMTIVPDANYLANKKDDITKNTYHKKTPAFSGLVFYQKQDGTFIGGQRYERGKMMGVLTPISDNELNAQVRSQNKTMKYEVADDDCNWYTMWDYTAVCYVSDADIICEWNGEIRWNFKVCSEGGGTISPIGGGIGSTPVDTLNKILDTCLRKAIKMALDSGVKNDFKKIMDSTILKDKNIILTFEEANLNDTTLMGSFTPWHTPIGKDYEQGTIYFNTQTIYGASQEMAVWTFYHELLHAYLGRIGPLMPYSYNHQYMATTFVNKMTNALKKLFPGMSDNDSIALGWAGLQGTPMWELKTSTQQNSYILVMNKYKKGSLGHKCP